MPATLQLIHQYAYLDTTNPATPITNPATPNSLHEPYVYTNATQYTHNQPHPYQLCTTENGEQVILDQMGGIYAPSMQMELSADGYELPLDYSDPNSPTEEYQTSPRRSKKVAKRPTKDLPEDSLAQRRAKNRMSASISRKRKKEYIATLEQTNTRLTTERLELQLKVATLTNYAWELKLKVDEMEKQCGSLEIEREEILKTLAPAPSSPSQLQALSQVYHNPQEATQEAQAARVIDIKPIIPPTPPENTPIKQTQPPPLILGGPHL
ncbi:hypothetical protein Pelo_5144 [Pelomyxa schiedti]|nr:hypothetical protein Pelo_5144 [Pelomyxa schiedti]